MRLILEFVSQLCGQIYFACYTHNEILFLHQGDIEENDTIPDKESDIKPRFHKSKTHSQKHVEGEDVSILNSTEDDYIWHLNPVHLVSQTCPCLTVTMHLTLNVFQIQMVDFFSHIIAIKAETTEKFVAEILVRLKCNLKNICRDKQCMILSGHSLRSCMAQI